MTLYQTTAKMVRESPKTYATISKEMGSATPQWVKMFAEESMGDPGVNKTEQLYKLMTGRELKLVAA